MSGPEGKGPTDFAGSFTEAQNARGVPKTIVHFGDVEVFLNDAWHQVDVESLSITNELDYDYLEVRGRLKKIMRPSDR